MGVATLIAIYIILWWVVLFAVLPFGVRADAHPLPGNDRGAPAVPGIARKFVWTTVISAVLLAVGWSAFHFGALDYRALFDPPGNHP